MSKPNLLQTEITRSHSSLSSGEWGGEVYPPLLLSYSLILNEFCKREEFTVQVATDITQGNNRHPGQSKFLRRQVTICTLVS